jgi:hypothetical protein
MGDNTQQTDDGDLMVQNITDDERADLQRLLADDGDEDKSEDSEADEE